MTIHWCGTGLSSGPGLRRLIAAGHKVVVWNRTVANAREAVGDVATDIRAYTLADLKDALEPGDIAISMLPADQHVAIAKACLAKGAHFVSSSYIAPEMRALDAEFREKGLISQNEVGLDPGIDHLMAHDLVAKYRGSAAFDPENVLSFTSYCGGVPKISNAFRYKFSWAPAGVLKALRSPSRSLRHFSELRVARPWDAITSYIAPLPQPESFEVYPNRDSYPFISDYHFDPAWKLKDFVRGTIRLNGWAEAWAPIFREIEGLEGSSPAEIDAALTARANGLLEENAYAPGEPDRVVLFVALKAEKDGKPVFDQTWAMDAWGDARGSAMGRLVSVPVSLAVESVLKRQIAAGVHSAPHDPRLVSAWMDEIQKLSQYLARIDHLA
ncbi:saccharopine dehydrogenase NADP-binding domain-containing protein [Xinfangfangia sp. CPCC 101601]|uniref:Saccharopine dehydrogenase NADP-binding domain-containing protein n=1 Tax=Pseudogemmobacter lacusdianii TaxID=3069608 RepID=A0ABU0VXA7_9RHOB|nr:saccharopine dehydrogenase family protein [Xinfangfangia sp. CPCC 101601]MDQ2066248.1 saccharopine dehydrogenase NADP-binding domain-containing protein [Xinfangfangia sp. CPCC 101601]